LDRTPGGSSGGEGAIIASGGSPLGLGTDIGGSLRIPAAFCGITSLKPTTGRVNDPGRFSVPIGQQAFVSQVGPLARNVHDLALALGVLNRLNVEPALPLGDYREVDLSKLRIGFYSFDGTLAPAPAIRRSIQEAAQALKQHGAQVVEWTPPDIGEAMLLFFGLLSADGGAGFKRMLGKGKRDPRANLPITLGSMPASFRAIAKAVLKSVGQPTLGNFLEYYGHTRTDQYWTLVERQLDYQQHFKQQLDRDGIDVILCPACPLPAFTHGASNDLATAGAYSILYNVLGYPAGVVPFTRVKAEEQVGRMPSKDMVEKTALKVEKDSTGLPVGVQVVARPWREHVGLAVMSALESSAPEREDFTKTLTQ
jgi:fatty acid amide hydrolase